MYKTYKLLFAIALLLPLFSSAQSNLKPGYIVALNGDTVKGAVDYKEWNKTPKEIHFKADNSSTIEKYLPANVLAFGVTGYAYYKSALEPISQSAEDLSSLPNALDTTFVTERVFLKTITQGKNVTLYEYNDKKIILFVSAGNETPQPLKRYMYISGDNRERNVDIYKQQLHQLADKFQPGNNTLKRDINQTGYYTNDIKKLIITLNGGFEDRKTASAIGSSKAGGRFFAGAGINASAIQYTFTAASTVGLPTLTNSTSIFPQVNIGYDYILNKNVGQWIFRGELSFTGSKLNVTVDKQEADDYIRSFRYDQYLFTFSPQIICNVYNGKQVKVFIDGGATFNLNTMTNKHNTLILYNNFTKAEMYNGELTFPQTPSFYLGVIGKAGVVIGNFIEIYAGYTPNVYLIKDSSYLKTTSYKAGVNILFGK